MNEDSLSSGTKHALAHSFYALEYMKGDMECRNPEFALYVCKNNCARTDTVFFPISEVCTRGETLLITINMSFSDWIVITFLQTFQLRGAQKTIHR